MMYGWRRLPAVSPLAANYVHLIVLRTTYNIARNLSISGRSRIELTGYGASVLIATYAIAVIERCDDTRELDRHISTILIAVHIRARAFLPLVSAMQVYIKFLAGMKGITTRNTDTCLRTVTTAGATLGVTLNIEVVRLIEGAVQSQVERISTRTGSKLEVGAREHTCSVQSACRLLMLLVTVQLARAQAEVAQDYSRHNRRFTALEMYG